MKTLQTVDGYAVTQEDISFAMKNVVSSHLTLSTLLGHAYTEVKPLPTLSVAPIASTFHQSRPPCSLLMNSISGTEWLNKVN